MAWFNFYEIRVLRTLTHLPWMWQRLGPQTGNAPQARTELQTRLLCSGAAMSWNTRTVEGTSSQAAGTVWRHIRRHHSGEVESPQARTPTYAHKYRHRDRAETCSTPMANRQRGYQTGQKPPGSRFIIHPRPGISFDLFPCSFHIPLNCRSYPSNTANCLKRDVWVIKTSKKWQTKGLYLGSGS